MFHWAGTWCTRLCHPLAKEFQLKKFSLAHEPTEDFVRSQWQKRSRSLYWLIYRWLLAAYFFAVVCYAMGKFLFDGKGFIYLTSWGFFLCMITSVYGAILVSIYYWRPADFAVYGFILKLYWAAYWTALVLATVITFVYWTVLYPSELTSVSETSFGIKREENFNTTVTAKRQGN